jgi:hypothetical protein
MRPNRGRPEETARRGDSPQAVEKLTAAREWARRFSWDRAATQTSRAIRETLGAPVEPEPTAHP